MYADPPSILWDSAHTENYNLLLHLEVPRAHVHLLVIPGEVLNDAFGTSASDLVGLAQAKREQIEAVFARAWDPERLEEAFEIGGPRRNVQFRLNLNDFR